MRKRRPGLNERPASGGFPLRAFRYEIVSPVLAVLFVLAAWGYAFAAPVTIEGHYLITNFPEVLLLMVIGIFVGCIGTLIGAGGGFIVVPVLMLFFGFSPQHAIGTSIAVVFLNALSGTFSYISQKRIDYELGIKFAVAAVPGVFAGALLAQKFSLIVFSVLFGILLLSMAYIVLFVREFHLECRNSMDAPRTRVLCDAFGKVHTYDPDLSIGLAGSFFVGIISGLFGIGGGIIHVPFMSFIRMPVHVATATSHFIITITSFFGTLVFLGLNKIDLDYSIFIGVGTIIGAVLGARMAVTTHADIIKKIIGFILIVLALKLIF